MTNSLLASTEKKQNRTTKLLSQILFDMLETTDFSKITVNDICINANVSRGTFYLYFEDKYDLLKFSIKELGKIILERAEHVELESIFKSIIEILYEKRNIMMNLILGDKNNELNDMLSNASITNCMHDMEELSKQGYTLNAPPIVIANLVAGGSSYLIVWWIKSNFAFTNEEMTKYIYDFYKNLLSLYITKD